MSETRHPKAILKAWWTAVVALICMACIPFSAAADPSGAYSVQGTSADGQRYSGTVSVTRVDEIYRVIWLRNGREIQGIAIGGAFSEGSLTVGPAHSSDLMLSIGFSDQGRIGNATLFLQRNDTFEGYVAREGDGKASQEVWTPIPAQ